jgi:hypothetical protein
MNDTQSSPVNTLGQALETRIMNELDAQPLTQYDRLLDLKNLAGESTGYAKAFTGSKLTKGTSVSINLMPGARYFNIHIIPEPQYDVPRFLFEGMLMNQGSQVSMDLFPDFDVAADIDAYLDKYAAVAEIYQEARTDDRFVLVPSRLLHMRAFSSPVFLLVFSTPTENLLALEKYAERYFDAWRDMHRNAKQLSDTQAAARQLRREQIGNTIMRLDPDRHMVVKVYGEETTRMIEQANIY